jgi:predicted methyltransferase
MLNDQQNGEQAVPKDAAPRSILLVLAVTAVALGCVFALPAAAQTPSPAVAAAVADPGRPAADTKRDADRHPAEAVAFAGAKPGQTVMEFSPGGGYFTRILAKTVGPSGHVYAVYMSNTGDRGAAGAKAVAADNPNVTVVAQTGTSFALPDKADLAWVSDNYHDYFNPGYGAGMDVAAFDKAIFDALKPGGVFIDIDYDTAPGVGQSQTGTLHRLEDAAVKARMAAAGFTFVGESPILRNPKDDHTLKVYDPAIRGQADQYVLKFRKPK